MEQATICNCGEQLRALSTLSECALGLLGDWVPASLCHPGRLATLATRCIASISTATTATALAWELVPQDVLAANVALGHTRITTTFVAMRTLELVPTVLVANHGRLPALGALADWVPRTPWTFGLAALAPRCSACVSAATTTSLAWEIVSIDVLAADVILAHTSTTATPVSTSA